MHGVGITQDHQLSRLASVMAPPASQPPQPFADAAAGTAAAAAFTVQLPPIRTGFGSPIEGSPVKKMVQSEAKGMSSSASFSDWCNVPPNSAQKPAARAGRQRSMLQPAAKASAVKAGPSAVRGAATLGLMLLAVVLILAIGRAAASPLCSRTCR